MPWDSSNWEINPGWAREHGKNEGNKFNLLKIQEEEGRGERKPKASCIGRK